MTRLFALIATLLSATLALGGPPTAGAGSVSVQLIALNDFHGNLEPPAAANGRFNSTEAGGAEYLATDLKHALSQNPNSSIVAAGDLVGASPLVSALFHDEPT